ncbi:MAG: hydroxyisourate hydrolase [Streptosporangiales bacterium]
MSALTTHVLDTARGLPATGVPVRLERRDGTVVGQGRTDEDGRVGAFGSDRLDAGDYRIVFDTGAYFAGLGQAGFYPEVTVTFTLADPGAHYHVPLLLSPYGYSTYRGS